jgi:hypothetical protein
LQGPEELRVSFCLTNVDEALETVTLPRPSTQYLDAYENQQLEATFQPFIVIEPISRFTLDHFEF